MSAFPARGRYAGTLIAVLLGVFAVSGTAFASHPQPAPDITNMDYSPQGFFGPGDPLPAPGTLCDSQPLAPTSGRQFNPSGKWNAFDSNVFETLCLPYRAAGDTSASDPYGNGGDPRHGYCKFDAENDSPGDLALAAGRCPNHQLEYSDYFAETMTEILGDFGVTIRRYHFSNPGGGNTQSGSAVNTAAVVPGADHPDETVIVSGHFDQTNDGPASAWDSAEGHAQVIRIAKIMADYWRTTGTRPSATVKFVPWDAEESGTLGSLDYVQNNVPPGEEYKIRGYFNTDPCAGGYPAFRFGNPADRVDLGIQIANPDNINDPFNFFVVTTVPPDARARIDAFNAKAPVWLEEVFDHLDDQLALAPGVTREIFVSTAEARAGGEEKGDIGTDVFVQTSRPVVFASDWLNFETIGVPFFNPGPDITGPSSQGEPGNPDGVAILHTPNDNLQTLNAYTSTDATGLTLSEGWIKGMEMCAHLLAWPMLQPEQGGGQVVNGDVVAYYEALPNEAFENQLVTFDASGTYQYADASARTPVDESGLTYSWDFGDGTTGTGKVVQHAYPLLGRYTTTLTVTGADSGTDRMSVPVVVVPSNFDGPVLEPINADDAADGNFTLNWTFAGDRDGFSRYSVAESTDFTILFSDDAESGISERWEVGTPTQPNGSPQPDIKPWQASDSGTSKFRGNQKHSGERSYWTGISPEEWKQPPLTQRGTSRLTTKGTISVPAQGDPVLSYSSLFQNEGDDQGRVEVALVDENGNVGQWQPVDVIQAVLTALGDPHDPAICSTATVEETLAQGFENRHASLAQFRGKTIKVRFNYSLGPDNRALSNPCGWYIDDITLHSGTFHEVGTATVETFEVTGRRNGTYGYRVTAVYRDGVATEASNVQPARVTNARPDLQVTAITASNARAREGEKVKLSATIANTGPEDAAASTTRFVLDGTTVLGSVSTPAIPGGGSTEVSINWDTRGVKGEHTIHVTADASGVVVESNEKNNSATTTVFVRGNKVENGSFSQANESATGPSSWSGSSTDAGTTSWSGENVSMTGTGGNAALAGSPSWTSDAVSVAGGETLTLVASVQSTFASSAASAGLTYLGSAGEVLETVTLATAPVTTLGFETLEATVTIPPGVTAVRVALKAFAPTDTNTAGKVVFDDVGVFGP